jgi:hypothetical protein
LIIIFFKNNNAQGLFGKRQTASFSRFEDFLKIGVFGKENSRFQKP